MHRSCSGGQPCERCSKSGRSSTCAYDSDEDSKSQEIGELKKTIAELKERIRSLEQQQMFGRPESLELQLPTSSSLDMQLPDFFEPTTDSLKMILDPAAVR
jgi:hypothetical protein